MNRIPSAMGGNNELIGQYEELRRQVLDRSLGIHRGPGAGAVDPERYESVDGRLVDLLKHAFFDNPTAIES